MDNIRLAAGCFLLCTVVLGVFGMRDTDRRKLPLAAYGAVLLFTFVRRGQVASDTHTPLM
jgi:hypothetical protein